MRGVIVVDSTAPLAETAQPTIRDTVPLGLLEVLRQDLATEVDGGEVLRRARVCAKVVAQHVWVGGVFQLVPVLINPDDEGHRTLVVSNLEGPDSRLVAVWWCEDSLTEQP